MGVRWGILSTANIGVAKVIPAIQQAANCEVVAIASRDEAAAERAAAALDIPRSFGGYEELLDEPDIDAVYIPLPNHLHAGWTIAAAAAGKHVLCEKPLALSSAEAEEMVAACDGAGVKLMEAFMYRLHPTWRAAMDMVASGRIGEVQAVTSWFSYFNDDPTNIRNIAEFGGGALMDIGCYSVNLSRMVFGGEPRHVESAVVRDPASGVDILTSALLEFEAGVATFTCSTRTEPDQRVDIYGTTGRISIEIPFNIPPDVPTRIFVTAGGEPPTAPARETIEFAPSNQYTIQAEAFAAAILGGTAVPTPPADAVANMRVIESIFDAGA